jgi:hypothetical protein
MGKHGEKNGDAEYSRQVEVALSEITADKDGNHEPKPQKEYFRRRHLRSFRFAWAKNLSIIDTFFHEVVFKCGVEVCNLD